MTSLTTVSPKKIAEMVELLPEFTFKNTGDDIASRIAGRNHSAVIARSDGANAGFMVCYEDCDGFFYNWIMGVLPAFRRAGIGKAFIKHFAESALSLGLPRLRVKTMNKYRSMLRLLIDCRFNIVAVQDGKITFESDAQQVARADALTRATQL